MSYRNPLKQFLLAAGALFLTTQLSLADTNSEAIERGKALAAMCNACHQANGGGMNIPGGESWPRLAGLNADYMVEQLKAFKTGTRKNPSMAPFANMLNDTQMQDTSLYFASLPAPATNHQEANKDLLAQGKQLAEQGDWNRYIVSCSSCHGADNLGTGASFPAIAGQQAGYIEQQLKAWQNDTRQNDPQQLMASIAKRLNDNDIKAVSAWLATQAPSRQTQGDKQ